MTKVIILVFYLVGISNELKADAYPDSLIHAEGKDVLDFFRSMIHKQKKDSFYMASLHTPRVQYSLIPAFGYSLSTGFAAMLSAVAVIQPKEKLSAKQSELMCSLTYSVYHQIILPLHASIWTKGNHWNLVSDNRFMRYPSLTYGLSPNSDNLAKQNIQYSYLKLHESVLRQCSTNWFAGVGIFVDYLFHEKELSTSAALPNIYSYAAYYNNRIPLHETAVGLDFQALYDNRLNHINPTQGIYTSIQLRENAKWMGSDKHWSSFLLDMRKYYTFPKQSHNVLAFWSYNWFTFLHSGKAPYLLLPSTGWDDLFNTGRGYVQGRYRGNNMRYLESEYRFSLVRQQWLGAVVFLNAESFSQKVTDVTHVALGFGGGLRIKVNKHTNTNLAIDYGLGAYGSRGFFVNLGEVF